MGITSETALFLVFLIDGAIVGFLFDIFRILRRSFKTPDFITYLEDIGFGILSGIILIFSIIIFNNGELRLFIFLGIILGIIIYMLTLSRYIIKTSVAVIKFFTKIISSVLKVVFLPVFVIVKIIKKATNKIIQKLTKKLKKLGNNKGIVAEK